MVKKSLVLSSLASVLLLAGCVTVPTAPTVMVLPGSQKGFDQFRADEDSCRSYAQATVNGPSQAAANNAAGNAVVGSAIGAAAGAIIGAATGQAGAGAAIGAGTGLIFGSASGGNAAGYSSYQLQRQYDGAYMQCMYARGNQIPGRVAYRESAPSSYPPPNYPPPNYPPPNYPAPNASPGGSPPAGYPPPGYPPPGTPPPRS